MLAFDRALAGLPLAAVRERNLVDSPGNFPVAAADYKLASVNTIWEDNRL